MSWNKFSRHKALTITAAKELGYGQEVIDKLEECTDLNQMSRIMKDARIANAEKEDDDFLREIFKKKWEE